MDLVEKEDIIPVVGKPWERKDRPGMVFEHLAKLHGGKVLSLGCGNGYVETELAGYGTGFFYRCIDNDAEIIRLAETLKQEKGVSNIVFEIGDNYAVEDRDLAGIIRLRTGADFSRIVQFLMPGGLVFYECIGQYSDGALAPDWSLIFPADTNIAGREKIEERKKELKEFGLAPMEERLYNSIKFYSPEELPGIIRQFLAHRRDKSHSESFELTFQTIRKNWQGWLGTESPESYPLGYTHAWSVYQKPIYRPASRQAYHSESDRKPTPSLTCSKTFGMSLAYEGHL